MLLGRQSSQEPPASQYPQGREQQPLPPQEHRAYYHSLSRKTHLRDSQLRTRGRFQSQPGQRQRLAPLEEQQPPLLAQHRTRARRTHHRDRSRQDFHDLRNIVLTELSILLQPTNNLFLNTVRYR